MQDRQVGHHCRQEPLSEAVRVVVLWKGSVVEEQGIQRDQATDSNSIIDTQFSTNAPLQNNYEDRKQNLYYVVCLCVCVCTRIFPP